MPLKKQETKKSTAKIATKTKKSTKKQTTKKVATKKVAVKKSTKKPVEKKQTLPKKGLELVEKKINKKNKKTRDEIWATGKRKTAVAQVRCFSQGQGRILINQKKLEEYFPVFERKEKILAPLKLLKKEKDFDFKIKVKGGGIRGQADAVSLGIARALVAFNPEWRAELKLQGLLRRDPRKKERKKPGLKRARRAPQWQKR